MKGLKTNNAGSANVSLVDAVAGLLLKAIMPAGCFPL